jgi:uncharacterized protein (TIGR03792 family)
MNQPSSFVEILEFLVAPEQQMAFIEVDRKIWTVGLAKYPAFDRKEIWVSAEQPDLVISVIYWHDRSGWKEINPQDLLELDEAFDRAFSYPYKLVKEKEYQRIEIPHNNFKQVKVNKKSNKT